MISGFQLALFWSTISNLSKQRATQNVAGAGGHLVATRRAATMNDH
jgi:hypothetical protein